MTEPDPTTDQRPTMQELADSLNRFDEIGIKRAFGVDFLTLNRTDKADFARALIFVAKRREGATDLDAFAAVETMTFGEVNAFFQAEPVDVDFEDPTSAVGKESAPLA